MYIYLYLYINGGLSIGENAKYIYIYIYIRSFYYRIVMCVHRLKIFLALMHGHLIGHAVLYRRPCLLRVTLAYMLYYILYIYIICSYKGRYTARQCTYKAYIFKKATNKSCLQYTWVNYINVKSYVIKESHKKEH